MLASCLYIVYIWFGDIFFLSGEGARAFTGTLKVGEESPAAVRYPEVPEGRVTAVSMMPCVDMVEHTVTYGLEVNWLR